jgi:hypothetical protein
MAERPPPGQPSSAAHSGTGKGHATLRKKIVTPVVFAAIGAALAALGFQLYSSPSEVASPSYATLSITSSFPIGYILYTVDQISPSVAEVKLEVELPAGTALPPAGAPTVHLLMSPPAGTTFRACPKPPSNLAILTTPFCERESQQLYIWVQPLKFITQRGQFAPFGAAFADLYVRARNFGEAYNGFTALAAIPAVTYTGSGAPLLETEYAIPRATSYDWSAAPTQFANGSYARWNEALSSGVTPGRTAVGINHASQDEANNKTFIAGVIFGLAGAALLAAVQEALHASD